MEVNDGPERCEFCRRNVDVCEGSCRDFIQIYQSDDSLVAGHIGDPVRRITDDRVGYVQYFRTQNRNEHRETNRNLPTSLRFHRNIDGFDVTIYIPYRPSQDRRRGYNYYGRHFDEEFARMEQRIHDNMETLLRDVRDHFRWLMG